MSGFKVIFIIIYLFILYKYLINTLNIVIMSGFKVIFIIIFFLIYCIKTNLYILLYKTNFINYLINYLIDYLIVKKQNNI
jgi:hypothetical protein